MRNKIQIYIYTLVAALVLVVGLTFAYFVTDYNAGPGADINTTTENVGRFIFTKGADIDILATLENFGDGDTSLMGTTTSKVEYDADAGVTASYDVVFRITTNEFVYTTIEETPELILKITGPDGEVTSLPGLTYDNTLGGFDVTTHTGDININLDYEISGGETHNWNATLTFNNLDSEQTPNEGKRFDSVFILESENTY